MLSEFTEFFKKSRTKTLDYKNFDNFIEKLDDIQLDKIKYELSLKCMVNEEYIFDMIQKDNNIEDIIKFVYYIIICYLTDYKDLELSGNKEMNLPKNKTQYIIFKTDTITKLNVFRLFLRIFKLVDFSIVNYLGIDLEFNTKIAALIQLCFEGFRISDEDVIYSFIFIFDPNQLKESDRFCLINNYLINDKYYKILHGAESLDIPYLFSDIFRNNKDYIIRFSKFYIDTRYLCEYYNLEQKNNGKCKIYSALLNMDVITESHLKKLKNNEDKMGPIYDIKININNISNELLKYTLYDVIFLKQFLFKFTYKNNIRNKIYISVIPEITQFILLEKRNIIDIFSSYKNIIDKTNNNYTFIKGKYLKLIDIFKKIKDKIILKKIDLKILMNINFYRTFIFYILKFIIYNYVIKNYIVYLSKNTRVSNIINLQELINDIKKLEFNNIAILIENLEKNINNNFKNILHS